MIDWKQSVQNPRRRTYKRQPVAPQIQQAAYQPQRGGNRYMGGSSTTTRPSLQEEEQGTGGLLESFGAVKEGYDQATSAKEKVQNAKAWFDRPDGIGGISPAQTAQDSLSGFQDFFTGNNTFTNADRAGSMNAITNDLIGGTASQRLSGGNLPTGGLLRPQAFDPGVGGGAGLQVPGNPGLNTVNPVPSGMPPLTPSQQMFAPGNVGQLGTAEQSLSQLNNATTVGAETTAASQAGQMGNMGAFMSAAGIGLNAYDMTQNGINAGNAMGLAGSAVILGTMNAWNPFGWALLAGSAAYSIFG